MKYGNNNCQTGRIIMKLTLGCSSLFFIFITPYLNITEIAIDMTALQGVMYSAFMICFWIIATSILHKRKPIKSCINRCSELKPVICKKATSS